MNQFSQDIKSLIDCLRSPDATSRTRARLQLVAMGSAATPSLITLLKDPNQHVRWEGAKALGGLADPQAVPALIDALGDPDRDVSWVASEALEATGERVVPALLHRLDGGPQPGQQPPDRLYRGAHQVLERFAKRGTHRYDRMLAALQAEEAEMHVPITAEAMLEESA
jgi:hypothetical protein